MMPMILTVFLSNNEQILTEVPITPETTCRDVVEFCKEPGEGSCHLAEVWRGNERPIPFDHMMYEHLQKWGPRREEVKFFLRHEDSPAESSEQGGRQTQEQRTQRNVMNVPGEKRTENGVGNPRVELTLSELQDMAARQQQQIENQQQMLVAKEQRLHFLKQQERRQQQSISENEKLQKLKERVEAQENKLKKIRAMRGQVDYSKIMNGNLSAEIERFSAMFQEKKQEVQTAILRVDQLSQQLEDLKKGKLNGFQSYNGKLTGPAAVELKRLYQELQIRNQLNQEQNSKLQQQKELLNKRNMEVAMMDKRISELRERLYGKKIQLNRVNGTSSPQSPLSTSGRVAAVGPYIQVPSAGSYSVPGDPIKPQSLTIASTAAHGRSKSNGHSKPRVTSSWAVSDLDVGPDCSSLQRSASPFVNPNDGNWPTLKQNSSSSVKPTQMASAEWKDPGMEGTLRQGTISSQPLPFSALGATEKPGIEIGKVPPPITGGGKQLPPSYGTYPSATPLGPGSTSSLERKKESSLPRPGAGLPSRQKPTPLPPAGSASQPGSSQQIQQRISVPPSPTYPAGPPAFPAGDSKPELPLTVAIRPFLADKGSRPQSPRKGPQTVNSSSIYSVYLQQATPPKNYQPAAHSTLNKSVKAVYGKPVLPSGSTSPSPLPFLHGSLSTGVSQPQPSSECPEKEPEQDGPAPPADGSTVESLPRPLSPTKLTPIVHSPLRYQSDADLEALRRKLANAPRPLKKRSSITEPEGPGGPNIQKLLYQRFNTLAGGMEGTPFYQPSPSQDFMGTLADVDNGNTNANGNLEEPTPAQSTAPLPDEPAPSSDANDNELPSPEPEKLICPQTTHQTAEPAEDNNNNVATVPSTEQVPSPVAEAPSPGEEQVPPPSLPLVHPPAASTQSKRTNLKKPNSERTGHGLRVRFNPLALLLDASLEGEFDLVQRVIYEVEDPSKPNDEGITPLHNAVCAGHHHIVKFLLDFGVNVNAADSDGWTPLHCAASCNSVHLCKQLVESGAAIFASTISDIETAADKCEEVEEGYIQCSQFLYGVQEKLGVMNKGVVYALWDYEAQNSDELSFHEGDALTILRRKDESETEWWWARLGDREGYVPKNLLGLYPRIKPRQRTLA
ncbi:PREDICTED: apoptosis-stimulating of p53 protein 1 isoform X1 [Propithecus coquereli]|uniref:apoptosis-stimulating of p53 protein 1 isoform X1 n=1 Tax=Propithecus coquereli TaxID=379532 RepID=UPI00063F68E2|nr:PREDICTED: apoptosis-stimulating of p53 protein 1 isoform X1 [Propithecus coquereli]